MYVETLTQFFVLVKDVLIFESELVNRFRGILFHCAKFSSQTAAFGVGSEILFINL